jgi:SulP family sulfate permease
MAQLDQLKTTDMAGATRWLTGTPLMIMLGFKLLTLAIIHFLPKITKIVPSSLAAILII